MNATAPTDSLAPVPDLLRGSTADPMPPGTIGQGVQGVQGVIRGDAMVRHVAAI
jgi:hypothetical protein